MAQIINLLCPEMSIWKKKYTHAQIDLCHSQKGELPACPQPSAGKSPLEIMGVLCVRATKLAVFSLQLPAKVMSILLTMFDTRSKTTEVFRGFTYDFNFLSESSRDFLEMMTRCWRIKVT